MDQPQFFLFDLNTGQKCEVFPTEPQSWTICEPDEVFDEQFETEVPKTINMEFTTHIGRKQGKKLQQKLNALFRKAKHMPRKLKKAARHIEMRKSIVHSDIPLGYEGSIWFETKDGYPYTKWVRKAIGKAKYKISQIIINQLNNK